MNIALSTRPAPTLFRLNNVPVQVPPEYWAEVALMWGGLSWLAGKRQPQRSWLMRLLAGALAVPAVLLPDIGHVWGHTISADYAGAPMDRIVFAFGLPRTLYDDNAVPPHTHRGRALGGGVFNLVGLLVSLLWRRTTRPGSLARELADVATATNGFLFAGGLTPLPFVDGGSILKWTLVEQGRTEAEADTAVHRINGGAGVGLTVAGVIALARGQRLIGVGLIASGAIALAAARDLLR